MSRKRKREKLKEDDLEEGGDKYLEYDFAATPQKKSKFNDQQSSTRKRRKIVKSEDDEELLGLDGHQLLLEDSDEYEQVPVSKNVKSPREGMRSTQVTTRKQSKASATVTSESDAMLIPEQGLVPRNVGVLEEVDESEEHSNDDFDEPPPTKSAVTKRKTRPRAERKPVGRWTDKNRESTPSNYDAEGKCIVEIVPGQLCDRPVKQNNRAEHETRWHREVPCRDRGCKERFLHKELEEVHHEKNHQKSFSCKNRPYGCKKAYRSKTAKLEHDKMCTLTAEAVAAGIKPVYEKRVKHAQNYDKDGTCTRCGRQVSVKKRKSHEESYHTEVKCQDIDCTETFDNKDAMLKHYKDNHKVLFHCKNKPRGCKLVYSSEIEQLRHEKNCTKTAPPTNATSVKKTRPRKTVTPNLQKVKGTKTRSTLSNYEADGTCNVLIAPNRVCGKWVPSHHRTRHETNDHREQKCRVLECTETFLHKQLEQDHFDTIHKKKFKCKNHKHGCIPLHKSLEAKLEHEKHCDPSKRPYACELQDCPRKYFNKGSLLLHISTVHNMGYLAAREYVDTKYKADDGEEEEDGEEANEDKDELPTGICNASEITVPVDPESNAPYQCFLFGVPKWSFQILDYDLFKICYHNGLRVPVITYQILFPALYEDQHKRKMEKAERSSNFRVDQKVAKVNQRNSMHFKDLSIHRGHLVRFKDYIFLLLTAFYTFLVTNTLPMWPHFNGSTWIRIENDTEDFAKKHIVSFVVTVGLFQAPIKTVGPKKLPFPNRFARIMLGLHPGTRKWDLRVYDVEHHDNHDPKQPLNELLGNINEIEAQLNMQLFPDLKPEQLGKVQQRKQRARDSEQYHHDDNLIPVS